MIEAEKIPCGSCPYRKDVPSGVRAAEEYEKLTEYDGETWEQSPKVFYCHRSTTKLCAGWLAAHNPRELLALRLLASKLNPSVFNYSTTVPCFSSGFSAALHGMRDIANPSKKAKRVMAAITRKRPDIKNDT